MLKSKSKFWFKYNLKVFAQQSYMNCFFGFLSKVRHLFNKFYWLFVTVMTLIGFVIENLSYNWSIITYWDPNINSPKVFCSIKLINKKAIHIWMLRKHSNISTGNTYCDYTIIKFDGESIYIKIFIYNLIRVESEFQIRWRKNTRFERR